MKISIRSCSRPRAPLGLTLIEVVAGLLLMATILVAMLTLKTRFTHQISSSNERLRGIAAADALLDQWWADPSTFPVNRTGTISDFPGLNWQTHLVSNDVVTRLPCRVVRLEVLADARVVTAVELMLPAEHNHAK